MQNVDRKALDDLMYIHASRVYNAYKNSPSRIWDRLRVMTRFSDIRFVAIVKRRSGLRGEVQFLSFDESMGISEMYQACEPALKDRDKEPYLEMLVLGTIDHCEDSDPNVLQIHMFLAGPKAEVYGG